MKLYSEFLGKRINIVDEEGDFLYDSVFENVVPINGLWYFAGSPKVLRVLNISGMYEYVLKSDENACVRDVYARLIKKADAVKLAYRDNAWVFKTSDDIEKIGNRWFWTGDVAYLQGDGRIFLRSGKVCYGAFGGVLKNDNVVRLSDTFYSSEHYGSASSDSLGRFRSAKEFRAEYLHPVWVRDSDIVSIDEIDLYDFTRDGYIGRLSKKAVYVDIDESMHLIKVQDLCLFYDGHIDDVRLLPRSAFNRGIFSSSTYDIIWAIKPGADTYNDRNPILFAIAYRDDLDDGDFVWMDDHNSYIRRSMKDEFIKRIENDRRMASVRLLEKERKNANNNYDEAGEDENNANDVDVVWVRPRGGKPIFDPRKGLITSPSAKRFGSHRYTIGVEIETSHGRIPNKQLEKLGIAIVSDGTIRAGEYVSPPFQGDNGFRFLKNMMDLLSKHTFVDNACATHIHIGGAMFNRWFSVNAIRLGCQVEKEIFAMQPQSKHPRLKHCSGISKCYGPDERDGLIWSRSYAHINETNWREVLGEYVFNHPFDTRFNSRHELSKWTEGRYKWLNLVNCNSNGRFDTIEFRAQASTTNFDKVYNYILMYLGFVWFVENRQKRIISGGVTLQEIIDSAYHHRRDLINRVLDFIEKRTIKFNRKDI